MSRLINLSVQEMRRGLLAGDFSCKELCEQHLSHITDTNNTLNSFIRVCKSEALERADKCDKEIQSEGDKTPRLTGIPVAIKDMIVTKGIETTCASKILKGFNPPYNSSALDKLQKAGAVIIGKTNQDEFAMGSSSENSAFGAVKNPWNLERVAGGSSGGSAVAVASYQAPLSLGTDTGGSVRQPASFCGVLGIKPTYGRISRYGVVAYASSCDQIGSFARNAADLALILETVSGHDPNDSTSMCIETPSFSKAVEENPGIEGKRIGVPFKFLTEGLQQEVQDSFDESLKILSSRGAQIVDIELPSLDYALAAYYIIVSAEASSNLSRYDGVRYGHRSTRAKSLKEMYEKTRAEGFGKEVKRRIMMGTYALSSGYYDAYYLKAQRVRTLIINDFKQAFGDKCDLIAIPTSPTTAFKIGEKTGSPLEMYLADVFTVPANLTGLPGISIPSGLDSGNLPIGVQLMAPAFEEAVLLQAADTYLKEKEFDNLANPYA
jgi:aspartyl-tRNA(Asn)/glutamyl-tRNA(Gln) amidotransferase subunit A